MTLRRFFVAADGRLHAPWRLLIFLLIAGLCVQVAGIAILPLLRAVDPLTGMNPMAASLTFVIGLLAAHAIMLLGVDRSTWSYVGLDAAAARASTLAYAWILGALPILLPSLVLLAFGWLVVRPSLQGSWWMAAVQVSLFLLSAALGEELFSRGYLFATLRDWFGWPFALMLTSIGFGLLHLANPDADARSVSLVVLAGVFLGAILLVTRSLYAAWIAHWAWNWVMAVPLHVAVSGLPLAHPDYQVVDSGPDWITGGRWGPEGGAAAAVGMLVGLGYLYLRVRRFGVWGVRSERTQDPHISNPKPHSQNLTPE